MLIVNYFASCSFFLGQILHFGALPNLILWDFFIKELQWFDTNKNK